MLLTLKIICHAKKQILKLLPNTHSNSSALTLQYTEQYRAEAVFLKIKPTYLQIKNHLGK